MRFEVLALNGSDPSVSNTLGFVLGGVLFYLPPLVENHH